MSPRAPVPAKTKNSYETPERRTLPSPPPAAGRVQRAEIGHSPAAQANAGGLIADDDARETAPGQMRKSVFLDQLRAAACPAADAELTAVGRSTEGCPYIERWIGRYRGQPAARLERAILKYAPDSAGAATAQEYIPLVTGRIRLAVRRWATTGDITGVPEEMQGELAGGGLAGGIGTALGSIGSAIGGAISGIFTKARPGGARQTEHPAAAQAKLGAGSPLEGAVKSRMETAFGHDFSRVRVHTDRGAADLSDRVNARAFTVGPHVAFGAGEYRPGTPLGDALIAHELAHVVQQGDGSRGAGDSPKLEADADVAAAAAVGSLWSGAKVKRAAAPRLRSGLQLQRCSRRATPATQAESDRWIQGRFGRRVAQAITEGRTASASVFHFEDDATFCPKAQAEGLLAGNTCDEVKGFVDPHSTIPRHVWIHRNVQGADTVLHEALHVYSHPDFPAILRNVINEGTTQYFTRRIADAQSLQISDSYPLRTQQIGVLVDTVGEGPLLNAYFQGQVRALQAAVDSARGPRTFEAWRCEMTLLAFEQAEALMRGQQPNVSMLPLCRERLGPL